LSEFCKHGFWASTFLVRKTHPAIMITVRTATLEDLFTLASITKEAYGGSALDIDTLELYFAIQPDGALLALDDNKPAGMVWVIDYQTFISVGVLGVLPEFQGQGIGRLLMEHAESWANKRGISAFMLDATNDGARLYEKLGYRDEDTNYRMNLIQQKSYEVAETIETATLNHLPELLEFDRTIFGADRTKVLELFLKEFAGRAFLSRDKQGRLEGFIIAQPSTIGPWIAENASVAEDLLKAVLNLGLPEKSRVLLPTANREGLELLERYGFENVRTLRHMVKGNPPKRQRTLMYGLARYALG
jgi:ribosomal protein S18 acetylase RimI-like enzyme